MAKLSKLDGAGNHHSDELEVPHILPLLPSYSPELNPRENQWDEIREKVYAKLEDAALYIECNPALVKYITSLHHKFHLIWNRHEALGMHAKLRFRGRPREFANVSPDCACD